MSLSLDVIVKSLGLRASRLRQGRNLKFTATQRVCMKQKYICLVMQFLLISGICSVPVRAQDSEVSLSEILQAVQKNVDILKEQNTNLISDEEITIEEFDNKGKIKKTTNIISEYRIIPTKSEQLFSYGIPQEERNVLSAKENGKIKKMKKFDDPVLASKNAGADLCVVFDRQNEEYFDYTFFNGTILSASRDKQNEEYSAYELNITEGIKGRKVYMIDIEQKEADRGKINHHRWNLKYKGVALIDVGTMEIVQLNRSRVTVVGLRNKPIYYYFIQNEYDKVKINDQFLTLLVAKIVKVYRMDGTLDTVYKYKYSNYKAFSVKTKIRYGAMEE
jgi:hypothetical protein